MAPTDPRTLAATYFHAWQAKDFATLRSVLADDATFRGPLGRADDADADACIQGLQGMAQILTDIVVHKTFVDGPDVLTWFALRTTVAHASPHRELEPRRGRQDHRHPRDVRRAAVPRAGSRLLVSR